MSSQADDIASRIAAAGVRAVAEARERRKTSSDTQLPPEKGGPKGLEPTRFGDWERKGIISDF
jgi:hypothetical protein